MMELLEKAKEKTIIFDGALGTMLMDSGHAGGKSPILFNLERPDLVADIYKQYYEAGSEVAVTNTFGGNPLKLATEGLEQQAYNRFDHRTQSVNRQADTDSTQRRPASDARRQNPLRSNPVGICGRCPKDQGSRSRHDRRVLRHEAGVYPRSRDSAGCLVKYQVFRRDGPPAKQTAGQIEIETDERRILQRRTVSIERPTSNIE